MFKTFGTLYMKNRRKQRNEKATCSEKVMIRFRGKKNIKEELKTILARKRHKRKK